MKNKDSSGRAAITNLRRMARTCIEQGYTLPQIALAITEEMEKSTEPSKRIYSGIAGSKWVEVGIYPWDKRPPATDPDDIEIGHF